jgi:hypothetical protein
MIRSLAFSFGLGLALPAAAVCGAGETFPVAHNEPITVRIVGGEDGKPQAHAHLILIAGYDRRDLHDRLWQEEALTDDRGNARLSSALANLPFVQVWVAKKHLCLGNPGKARFSVELIRRDGLSTPNRCGIATVEDAPGIFNVFVKVKAVKVKAPSPCPARRRARPATPPAATPEPAPAPVVNAPAATAPVPAPESAPPVKNDFDPSHLSAFSAGQTHLIF